MLYEIDNGDVNLIVSALGAAEAQAGRTYDADVGDYGAARDRLQAQGGGPAGADAQWRLDQLKAGIPPSLVYPRPGRVAEVVR